MKTHEVIKAKRKLLKLSEQALADRVGVTRGAVQQWERPNGTAPSRAHQEAVARALNLTVTELMGGIPLAPLSDAVDLQVGQLAILLRSIPAHLRADAYISAAQALIAYLPGAAPATDALRPPAP